MAASSSSAPMFWFREKRMIIEGCARQFRNAKFLMVAPKGKTKG
jgi:hypothetical protein